MNLYSNEVTKLQFIFKIAIHMKQTSLPNPSRSEILTWINTHVEQFIGPVKKIEDLGNGVAYLFLIAQLRPASIKVQKIIKNPVTHHDSVQNLRMLSSVLQKLDLHYSIQGEKLAQMKYQQNFYLSSFLFKSLSINQEFITESVKKNNQNANVSNKLKKVKIIPPQKKIAPTLTKDPPPQLTVQDLDALHVAPQKKLKEIQSVFEESQSTNQRLQKIANILNLNIKRSEKKSIATMTHQIPGNSLSIEASYKRFLRPSLCQRSSFLNSSKIPYSYDKTINNQAAKSSKQSAKTKMINTPTEILPMNQFEGEMLLSQKKEEPQVEKGEYQTKHQIELMGQFCFHQDKEEWKQQKQELGRLV